MFSALMVETIGRKYAIGICFGMGSVFTAVFAVSESETVIVIMTILMEFFLAGANGALSAITVEMFPTTLRSTAMGACRYAGTAWPELVFSRLRHTALCRA
jgi:putative MFS transporter